MNSGEILRALPPVAGVACLMLFLIQRIVLYYKNKAEGKSPISSSPPPSLVHSQPFSPNASADTSQAALSLIFGVLGIFPVLCILTIPGIILGHISLNKANEFPQKYGGKDMAKWGMGLSYFSLIFYFVCGVIIGVLKASINSSLGR